MRRLPKRALFRGAAPGGLLACPACRQRRYFAGAADPAAPPPKPPPPAGLAALPSRQLLAVSGPDAAKFLQGIITANVLGTDGRPRADAFYTGFLNATGRVLHDAFVYPVHGGSAVPVDDDGFLVEADASQMARLAQYIKRYKLRAKFAVRTVAPDDVAVWQAWDDAAELDLASDDGRIVVKDPRAPAMGYRILQLKGKRPETDLEQSSEDAYTIRRYLQGVAEGQDEILREQGLPLESNMEAMHGIDFRKGCYVGQELTIRTKHRGVVRKRILPCMVYADDERAPEALAYEPRARGPAAAAIPSETSIGRCGKRGRSAGKWLRGVGNVGLGLCRLEIMTDVVLPGEQAAATYKPGDEFVLEWGDEESKASAKIKAFVPDWLRRELNEPQH